MTLSQCISKIEEGLGQQAGHQEQAHLLPPEAAQVRSSDSLSGCCPGGGGGGGRVQGTCFSDGGSLRVKRH